MPRAVDASQIFRKLTAIDLYRIQTGTIGDTVTTAAVTGGTSVSVNVSVITNFTAADPVFIIGDGGTELITAIGTPATTPMPWSNQKAALSQSTGARFVEAVKVPIGKIAQGSVKMSLSKPLTQVLSEIDDGPITYLDGVFESTLNFGLYSFSILNLQLATGYADSEVGVGTAADPYQGVLGGLNQAVATAQVFRLQGLLMDAKNVQIDCLDVKFETSGDLSFSRTEANQITVAVKFGKCIVRQYT